MSRAQRNVLLLSAALAAASCAAVRAQEAPAAGGGFVLTYYFDRRGFFDRPDRPHPTHHTTLIALRSPRKPFPLFATGINLDGKMTFTFADDKEMDVLADGSELTGTIEYGKTAGEFRAVADAYGPVLDRKRLAGADLLAGGKPTPLTVQVRRVRNFSPVRGGRTLTGQFARYNVKIDAVLARCRADAPPADAGRDRYTPVRQVALEAAGYVAMTDGVLAAKDPADKAPGAVTISGRATFAGADLGLTGDDAGEIEVHFVCVGYTDYAAAAGAILKGRTPTLVPKE